MLSGAAAPAKSATRRRACGRVARRAAERGAGRRNARCRGGGSYSAGMAAFEAILAADRPWSEIPGVHLIGGILGILLVLAAIRYLFRK